MAQNLKLDPTARDYVFVNGSPVPSDGINEKCYYALAIPQNNWLYGVQGQGSLLYTLSNKKHTSTTEQEFAGFANDAINRQVVQPGFAEAVQTENIQTTNNGTSNQIEVIPSQTPIAGQLSFTPV